MTAYQLPAEFSELRGAIERMVIEKVAPRARAIDADAQYPSDVRALFADHDVFALAFDVEYGGTGTGSLMFNIAVESVARACASSALILMLQSLGTMPIALFGHEEQKRKFLPACARGELLPAFALSEPSAGSDPGGIRTTATRDGNEWVLNGTKNWISNAGEADFYLVFAVTNPDVGHSQGISSFLVEADRPGFLVGKLEDKMGIRGSPTGQLILESVRVPSENLVGQEGAGFKIAMATLDRSGVAAQAVGVAQGAIDFALGYSKEREQFGRPIGTFQGIQFKLADMETRTAAARELLYRASTKIDEGDSDLGKYSAMAKLFASDTAMWVTTEAVQVLGGYGFVNDYPLERMMRDAKITQIYEGTNEIQRLVIARSL
jgi:alkylation response protein AidB-like acyl-CoA dehydrogenase